MPSAPEIAEKVASLSLENVAQKTPVAARAELKPWPDYIQHRIQIFDRLKAEHDSWVANQPTVDIAVTLPDGKVQTGQAWRTTPFDVISRISKGLAESAVIAKVNGQLWDLDRVLEGDCELKVLKFEDDDIPFDQAEGRSVFWHSSAHILGEAMERLYGGCLCFGPPIEGGFHYDIFMDQVGHACNSDFAVLDKLASSIVKEKQPFERLMMTKDQLREMFAYNPFKLRIINERIKEDTATVYRCGPLIDLCRGPHVRHTGKVKAIMTTKVSSSYWEGKDTNESLDRVYGISFPDAKQLRQWKELQEEAAKRNHRKIGNDQSLFFFHEMSPGSCFFEPNGAHIFNKLIELMRDEYWKRDFTEVISPNVYSARLWKTSGHWQHYADNMFRFSIDNSAKGETAALNGDVVDDSVFGLKPMNCPGHCLIFDHGIRSWRDLPLRLAEFGVLHRNEASGSLTGLTRVRRFQQDDAHIFCTPHQIETEVEGCLDFLKAVYETFGFDYSLYLSTRPEDKYIGSIEDWDAAEKALSNALDKSGMKWRLNPGDGAFYGPKIDVILRDALRRQHQCGTIQLDFQLPQRFNLSYVDDKGEAKTPVMIHRAILGSVERFIGVICESLAGKWPFWLSPRQAMIVTVAPTQFDAYAKDVRSRLRKSQSRFCVDVNLDAGMTMNKKVRMAQMAQYNFILVIGEREAANGTVNVRTRDNAVHGEFTIDEVMAKFELLATERCLQVPADFWKKQSA